MDAPPPLREAARRLRENVRRVFRGQDEALDLVITGLLSCGHVLIEGVPGVGKTVLARALARSLEADFRRIQFTPDLLPADVLGVSIYDKAGDAFVFRPGPVFAHVVLADEINRTSPRTQAALLEAMNEGQVTVDGVTRPLPRPFLVLATQNPLAFAGTYPLPESQLDRFFLAVTPGYPSRAEEAAILRDQAEAHPLDALGPVLSCDQVAALQDEVRRVTVSEPVAAYLLDIVEATRASDDLLIGASPRAALALFRAAQARAFLQGRGFAQPDDVKALAAPVLAHRLVARGPASSVRDLSELVAALLDAVAVPL